MKKGEPGILCKLDVEKAYDRVSWQFLFNLQLMGFGETCLNGLSFVSTVRYSVLMNAEPVGFFPPQRELRQGDPMSSFLFISVMKAFRSML